MLTPYLEVPAGILVAFLLCEWYHVRFRYWVNESAALEVRE